MAVEFIAVRNIRYQKNEKTYFLGRILFSKNSSFSRIGKDSANLQNYSNNTSIIVAKSVF